MNIRETTHIIGAIFIGAIVIGFKDTYNLNLNALGLAILFSALIIATNVAGKKLMARSLDADVEHEIWTWSRYGFKPHQHTPKPVPVGLIIPLIFSAFSIGTLKVFTILTYEVKAMKRRAAKRFGYYSFTEITDWDTALIGASGIIATLALAFLTYWYQPLEPIARAAAFYAFFNILPISKLDGNQIFFGSRVLWTALAIISLIFAAFALI